MEELFRKFTMREARILKSKSKKSRTKSRVKVRGRGWKGGSGGGMAYKLVVLNVFCVVGLFSLMGLVAKLSRTEIKSRGQLVGFSALLLLLTLFFMVPPVLFLAMDDHAAVGIVSIVVMCLMAIPLVVWIFVAVRKLKQINEERWEESETPDFTDQDDALETPSKQVDPLVG